MLDDFDKYAQSAFGSDLDVFPSGSMRSFSPKFDITEHEKHYLLQGELPGVPQENITIEFTDPQTIVIRGHAENARTEGDPSLVPQSMRLEGKEKEPAKIENGEAKDGNANDNTAMAQQTENKDNNKNNNKPKAKYWRSERSFGEFSRVFSFPTGVNQDAVEAKLEHGVLNIIVPKVEKKGGKKIEIKL